MEKKTWNSTYPILCVFLLYLLSNFHSTRDSNGEDAGAAAVAIHLFKNVELQANIGQMFSEQASFLISLGNKSQVPIINFSATTPSLAWTRRSPYLIRATTNDSSQVDAIGALVKDFGCREVVPIYADDEFGEGIIPFLSDALGQVNSHTRYRSVTSPLATDDQVVAELLKLMRMQKRVFIVPMLSPFSSRLFSIAEQKGTMTRDYAWIITDGITDELSSTDPSAIESMQGIKGVKPYVPKTKELDDFAAQYKRRINPRGREQDLDIFGLQAYDSATALAIAVEKANLGTPKYQEVNISRNYTDVDGFGISDAGLKLIQDISSTTFKGLARNLSLVIDGQLQSPPYEIVNIVGPRARCISYWRKKTGTFKGVNFTSAKPTLGLTIWPGYTSSSPKGWVIPTNGKTLRVVMPVTPGFIEIVRVTWNPNNSKRVEGFCVDVFDTVMKALTYGLTYEFIPFVGDYGDLIHLVRHGSYDAAVGERYQYVDFTRPRTESVVYVSNSYKSTKVEGHRIDVFNAVTASLPIGYLVWVLEHQINKYFRHPFWHQLGMTLWFAFSAYVFSHRERVVAT